MFPARSADDPAKEVVMKLVLGLVAGFVIGGSACGAKTEAPPADKAAPAAVNAPVSATPSEAAAHEAGHDEAGGCGDHAMAEAGKESDCPFEHERQEAAAGGCGDHAMDKEEAAEPAPGAGGAQHLGSAFTLGEQRPLGDVLKTASPDKEELVRVAGTVEKVCQKRGCWMVVKDGDLEARVIMKDHAFAIPFDSKGMKASVEGTLKVKVFTEAQAKHLAEDGKEDPSKVEGETKEFLLTATGVQLGG